MYTQSFGKSLKAGLLAGVYTAVIAVVVAIILLVISGMDIKLFGEQNEITLIPVVLASIIPNFIGSMVFYLFNRITSKPVMYYWILALIFATFLSFTAPSQLAEGFVLTGNLLHYVVAAASAVLIPRLLREK